MTQNTISYRIGDIRVGFWGPGDEWERGLHLQMQDTQEEVVGREMRDSFWSCQWVTAGPPSSASRLHLNVAWGRHLAELLDDLKITATSDTDKQLVTHCAMAGCCEAVILQSQNLIHWPMNKAVDCQNLFETLLSSARSLKDSFSKGTKTQTLPGRQRRGSRGIILRWWSGLVKL